MTREELVQKRTEIFGKIEANNEILKDEARVEEHDTVLTESDELFDEMHGLDKKIRFESRKEAAEERFSFDEEFSVVRRPIGTGSPGNSFRQQRWSDPITDESETPNHRQISDRDRLVIARWDHGADSLNNEEKVISCRKFAGERLTLRFIAGGGNPMSLNSDEMDSLKKWQRDYCESLSRVAGGVTVGASAGATSISDYFVPTETERGILYEAQFQGPLGSPAGGYGRWDTYSTGGERQVNVNTSAKTTIAAYVDELGDVGLLKPSFRLQKLNYATIAGLMPWSIQADQDSIESMETELRFNLGMAFGNRLNKDLTKDNATQDNIQGLTSMLVAGAASPAGTNAPPARVRRLIANAVITSDEVIDLKRSVDSTYRNAASQFAFMVHDSIALQIEKMREGTGDAAGGRGRGAYLYQRATADGPPMIHGVPVVENNGFDEIPTPAANGNEVFGCLGDFRHFRVGLVRGIAIQVLRELYARQLQIGLLGHMRYGSFIPDRNAFRLLQNKA